MNRRRAVLFVVALAVIGGGIYVAVRMRAGAASSGLVASGTVEATDAALGFQVAGRIERVGPHEGDRVKAGETLAVLDRAQLEARAAQARAAAAAARATLRELEAGSRSEEIAQAEEGARAAHDRFTDAQREFDRMQGLVKNGTVSQEQFDKSRLALAVATSERDQADQQLKLVRSGPRVERIDAQRASVTQSDAAVREADAMLANAVASAPFDGVVTVRHREPGEIVGAGAPVLTVENLADRWVRIYVAEDRIGAVRIGQSATITADTYPGKMYAGIVSFISSEAEFTPRNVQTAEERVKLVYAVKVRITGDAANDLKPGMPADVQLALQAR